MSGGVSVRPARAGEAAAVVPLYEWLFAPPGSRPPQWDAALAEERLAGAISSERSTVLVAESDGAGLTGICTAYLDLDSVRYGPRCWVEDLAVDPDQRSRGIGKALLDAALAWAQAKGASHLELDSGIERKDAHRFYEREGANVISMCFGWHGLGRER